MKVFLLLAISCAAFTNAGAQSIKPVNRDSLLENLRVPYGQPHLQRQNIFRYKPDYSLSPVSPFETDEKSVQMNMPNAFNEKLSLTFIENNDNGFSVYRSTPDKMYILKPDSTFISKMPVK